MMKQLNKPQLAKYLKYCRKKIREGAYRKLVLKWAPINYHYIRLDTKYNDYNIKIL